MIDKKVYSEFQKLGFVVNDFMKEDLVNMHQMLMTTGATIRDANIMLILAIRDTHNKGGQTTWALKRTVELWSLLGLKNGDEVKQFVDQNNAQVVSNEEELPDIPVDVDIENTDWSKYY